MLPFLRSGALALGLAALGCAPAMHGVVQDEPGATRGATAAAPAPRTLRLPRLRIVDAKLGAERAARSEPIVVPFGVNQNGNELIYALLERAAERRARAVGDLTLYMTFRWRGAPVECRTRVMLEGDPRLAGGGGAAAAEPARSTPYDTDIEVYRPQQVEFIAEDRDLACEPRRVAVVRERLLPKASDRTAEARGLRDLPSDDREKAVVFETHEECAWRQVTRRTTRHDYEVKLGFVPPDWERLSVRFAKRRLVPAAPQCYTITEEALAEQPIYRLTALASVPQGAPRVLPSRAAVDAQFTPVNIGMEECMKILNATVGVKNKYRLEQLCSPEQQRRNAERLRLKPDAMFEENEHDAYDADPFADEIDEQPFDAD
jgi:hypothetical protein